MSGLTLRQAGPGDAEALLEMQLASFAALTAKYGTRDDGVERDTVESVRRQILSPASYYYMAIADGRPVGGIVVRDSRNGADKSLPLVYILPEHRRKGYGRRMLAEVRRRHGLYRWQVNTILQEEGNRRFYESAGFTPMSTTSRINDRADLIFYQLTRGQSLRLDGGLREYRFHGWEQADVPPANREWTMFRDPRDLYDALRSLWSAETCAPRMRPEWSLSNPTLGQCSITAFLAQDIFGGEVYGVPLGDGNFHCYNHVNGRVFDLTSEQFGPQKLCYEGNPLQAREVHFAKAEKKERYIALKKALNLLVRQ